MLEETHPSPSASQIPLCVCCVCHVWVYDIERLSTAFQTDRPELVNRCCWSSWRWGHGASPQSLIKEELPQPPVIPATWFMSPCQRTLWLLATAADKEKVHRFPHSRRNNNMARRKGWSHLLLLKHRFKGFDEWWNQPLTCRQGLIVPSVLFRVLHHKLT